VPTGTAGTPLNFAGNRSGNSVSLTSNLSTAANGNFETGKVTGAFQTAAGGTASFSATTSSCP
jgi:autotransporter translocation and assembly factor TamB